MPEQPTASPDLVFARQLADLAESIALPRFRSADLRIDTKPDRTHVTDADLAVEHALRERIASERPSDGFFGEESGTREAAASDGPVRRWILDPIDGTANFLRGVSNWATLIALEVDGTVTTGVVSMPALGARWFAELGGGAWREDRGAAPVRIRVSGVRELADASLSFQSIGQWRTAERTDALLALSSRVWRDRAYGDSWSYMLLAEGLLDIVAEFDVKAYDLAAHVPIVREAGGRFTDVDGNETAWSGSALATNGLLHAATIAAIAEA
ncbi:MAG: histidinol phosphatase [Leucobacter sp.]|nr:histidinol phosphatase [Leucobacter sp.]